MNRSWQSLLLSLLFLSCGPSFSQSQKFKDLVEVEGQVFAISERGEVVSWNLKTFDRKQLHLKDTSDRILSVCKGISSDIFIGTKNGFIYSLDSNLRPSQVRTIKYPINYLFQTSSGRFITIVPNAVYDPLKGKHWTKFENHTNGLIVKKKRLWFTVRAKRYFQMPQYALLDSHDRLWMTASFGEFGGDVEIFDAKKWRIVNNKFDSINANALFPKSVFEDAGGNIFITSGLQHFMNLGQVYVITSDHTASIPFSSSGIPQKDRKTGKVLDEGGLFIGPGAFNELDTCIYLASSRGFFKAKTLLGKIGKLVPFTAAELTWSREPLAIGASMAVKKMIFSEEHELIFLTANNGIGIERKGQIIFLK